MSTLKKEVAFIDANVADLDQLIAGLRSEVEPIVLQPDQSAAGQMARALDGRFDLAAVHVVAHGHAGGIDFGDGTLSRDTLSQHTDDLIAVRRALADDGSLQLYACNVAAGDAGQRFVDELANLLTTDVFASADKVGADAHGGNWELAYGRSSDRATPRMPFQASVKETWQHVLAITDFRLASFADTGSSNSDGFTKLTTVTFSGTTSQLGETVTIFLDTSSPFGSLDGGDYQTTVLSNGTTGAFSGTLTFSEGAYSAIYAQGQTSGFLAGPIAITIDTTAPASSVSAPDLVALSDTGTSNTDDLTNDATPTLTGSGVEANATVTLYDTDGTTVLGTDLADGAGNWSIDSSALAHGLHTLTVKQTDLAGNPSAIPSSSLTIDVDTQAPTTTITLIDISSDTGSDGDFITNVAAQTVTGTLTAPLALGEILQGRVDGGGWTDITNMVSATSIIWTGVTLSGTNLIEMKVTDAANNDGPLASEDYELDTTVDEAPAATLVVGNNPSAVQVFGGLVPFTVSGLDDDLTVAQVVFTDGTGSVQVSVLTGDGIYTANLSALTGGTITATLRITDLAGNTNNPSPINGNTVYHTVQAAVAAASGGDTIHIADGNYSLGSSTLTIDDGVTIIGESESGVVIDGSGITGYGILVTADNTSLSNFTLTGSASGTYGLKIQPDTGAPSDRLINLDIENVTVQGFGRSEFDLNAVDGATLTNITADGDGTAGVGIALTDSANIILTDITTLDNQWGSVALYSTNTYYNQQLANITFAGSYTPNEAAEIYADDASLSLDLGAVTFPPSYTGDSDGVWKVTNDAFRGGLNDSDNFTFFFANKADAVAFALAIQSTPAALVNNTRSVVEDPDGIFVVEAGLSIQAAVDAASDADTIEIGSGTYVEQVQIDDFSDLTLTAQPGDTVNIVAPVDVVETARSSTDREMHAVVTVEDSINITLNNINIDGDGRANTVDEGGGAGQAQFVGVFYRNASGTLTNVDIEGVRDPYPGGMAAGGEPLVSGMQRGVGLQVDNDSLLGFTMTGGSISDFQKNATVFNRADLNVAGVTIVGGGAQTIIAQNGFQALNSTGSISGNTITGIGYAGPANAYSGAILAYGNTDLDVTNNTIIGSNDDAAAAKVVGIYIFQSGPANSGGNVTGNTISYVDTGIAVYGDLTPSSINIASNTVTDLDITDPYVAGVDFEPSTGLMTPHDVEGTAEHDILYGGAGNDTLSGLEGDDEIDGGAGFDLMIGGDGDDTYAVDDAADTIVEAASEGNDTVNASVDYVLAPGVEVENLSSTGSGLALTGNEFDQTITGDAGSNVLKGTAGDDSLDGDLGVDNAIYDGNLADFTISFSGGEITVTDNVALGGDEGEDTLSSVETLSFADTDVLIVDQSATFGTFTTIQAAINAASNGDTIIVVTGSYDEDLTIDKAVTIQGAKVGVAGSDGSRVPASGTGESTIIGRHHVTAAGAVTLDGLRFVNDGTTTGGGPSNPTLQFASGYDHVLTNSIFYSLVAGGGVDDRAISMPVLATGEITISDNYITGAFTGLYSTASWGRGIWFDGGGVDLTVENNTFEYTRTGINLDMSGTSNALVTTNNFVSNSTATSVGLSNANVTFTDNDYKNVADEFNLRNVTGSLNFDAELAVDTVTTGYGGNDYVVVYGGAQSDALKGTSGIDYLDDNAAGIPFESSTAVDNDLLEGRGGNDILVAEFGNDTLDGGTGADSMTGGAGNDTYIVDNAGDTVTELASEGTDLVKTTLNNYTLGANVENLTFTGSGRFYGNGNGLNNVITGGSGNDVFFAGLGVDVMIGLGGNDVYSLRDADDSIVEAVGGGIDTIKCQYFSLDLTLAKFDNVENAILDGNKALNLTGDSVANKLTGNSAANIIAGGGGRDDMTGGAGSDTFDFNSTSDAGIGASRDVIRDFVQDTDLIDLWGIDAKSTVNGNNAFVWIDSAAFSGAAGQLRYFNDAGNTIVQGDTNGDSVADFEIELTGTIAMYDGDFIL